MNSCKKNLFLSSIPLLFSMTLSAQSQEFSLSRLACLQHQADLEREDSNGVSYPLEVQSLQDLIKSKDANAYSYMVQRTILSNFGSEPVSPTKALKVFFDLERPNSVGRNGGGLRFRDIQVSNSRGETRTVSIAHVSHYPGDNEYGYLFALTRNNASPERTLSAREIGVINDGDITCY